MARPCPEPTAITTPSVPPVAASDARAPIEPATFREAMGRLGAAVTIVTTDGPAGRHGLTASAVCSVTDAPPTVLVCLNRRSGSYLTYSSNRVAGINVLASQHEGLAMRFAGHGADGADRFADGGWSPGMTGAPLLDDALVALDCDIDQIIEVGTHSVLFCVVTGARFGPVGAGLIYQHRAFHRIPMEGGS